MTTNLNVLLDMAVEMAALTERPLREVIYQIIRDNGIELFTFQKEQLDNILAVDPKGGKASGPLVYRRWTRGRQ